MYMLHSQLVYPCKVYLSLSKVSDSENASSSYVKHKLQDTYLKFYFIK